ncbi:Ig-like domain-containing protein [Methanobrevibacter millerae]|uniref:Adhesin-like protein n=1 Tax=Methanobrevibacter millerae TaxID=230361 RepID=A0A0U3CTN0_9EURY|nr:Ig-like domain-containing protein [Methanobrevibacter millerae]ALT69039.1 adhesin-like protein [Methanobrevibacter millerae]
MNNDKIIIALVVVLIVVLAAGVIFLNPGHAKVDSRAVVTSNSTLQDGDNFTIRLTDLNNTPIANQRVNITIIDANGGKNPQAVTTDANGEGKLQLNGLTPGEYTMNVTYGGNDNYTACNTTQKLTMEKKVVHETVNQQSTKSSSSSNEIFFDPEVNVYYDSNGIVVDPDGKHSQSVGSRYSDLREYRDRWERGEPVMV